MVNEQTFKTYEIDVHSWWSYCTENQVAIEQISKISAFISQKKVEKISFKPGKLSNIRIKQNGHNL